VSKDYHLAVKVLYYDRKGELQKVANFTDFQKYNVKGKELWRSHGITMDNVQTLKKTVLTWPKSERKFGVELKDKNFDSNAL